jgi:hypothetical protein
MDDPSSTSTEVKRAAANKRKSKLKKCSRQTSSSKSVLETVSSEASSGETKDGSPEAAPITPANNQTAIDLTDSPCPPQMVHSTKQSADAKSQKKEGTSKVTPASDNISSNEKKKKKKKKSATSLPSTTAENDVAKEEATESTEPPKKKRAKRSFHDQILYTMLTSCKPYTLKSLAKDTDLTVEALRHAMLSFVDKKLVITKEFPSKKKDREPKKLYWANPMSIAEVEAGITKGKGGGVANHLSKLIATTDEIQEASTTRQQLEQQYRMIQLELQPLLAIPTMKQIEDENVAEEQKLAEVMNEIEAVKERTANASSNPTTLPNRMSSGGGYGSAASYYPANRFQSTKPTKPQDKTTLKRKINHMLGEYRSRKRKCLDFVDTISDAMEKRPKEVMGDKVLCLDTDEMEWGMYEDGTTGKVYGTKPKTKGKRGLLSKKSNDEEDAPIVKIPAKYKDV